MPKSRQGHQHPAFTPEAIDEVRSRIKTVVLLAKLQDHALGEDTLMHPTQVQAAQILLKKTLPDLQHVDHTSGGGPLVVEITRFSDPDED